MVSDRHFGGPGCRRCGVHFGAPIVASAIEASAMSGRCKVDRALEYDAQTIASTDILAIPTPGHTPGQMAFLIEVSGLRCLFAGDFAYRSAGEWRVGNKSRKAMQRGIASLGGHSFDVYVGCADYGEAESFVEARSIGAIADQILASCTKP